MTEQPQLVPPGWYPDASGSGRRWWDGTRWTAHTDASVSAVEDTHQASAPTEMVPRATVAAPVELLNPTGQWAPSGVPSNQSPPAWHRDPHGSGVLRWWDGIAWTQHTSQFGAQGFTSTTVVNIAPAKSVGVAFLLTFFFGPLGLFYSSVVGGVVMLGVETLLFILGFVTFGLAWLLFGFTWVGCIIWGCVAASGSNTSQIVQTTNRL